MPPTIKKTAGGSAYVIPFIGRVDHTVHVQVDLTLLSTSQVDTDGILKPGVVLPMHGGALGSANGVAQVETATVAGVIIAAGAGNVSVEVSSKGFADGSKTFAVAVENSDTAAQVAAKIRAALSADAETAALFTVSGAGAAVILTSKAVGANDSTLNIATSTGTATGLTAAPTSANTTPGVAPDDAVMVYAATKVADGNTSLGTITDKPLVTCAVIAVADRYLVERNLGRLLNSTEVAALKASKITLHS